MKKIILIVTFAMIAQLGMAQVQLSRVGIGLSAWNRAGDGEFASMFQPLNTTSSNRSLIPSLFGTLDLYKGIGLEGRVAISNATYTGESVFPSFTITDEIRQRIIPLSFGAVYHRGLAEGFSVGAGAGLNTYYIQNEVTRTVVGIPGSAGPTTFTGRSIGAYFKADAEYMLSEAIGVGLDIRYNTGNYNLVSAPEPGAAAQTNQIGLAGIEIGLSLRYRISTLFSKQPSGNVGDYFYY
ncbi:MAG: outer membrane beta-barrel protein [Mongoliitalea sp.]